MYRCMAREPFYYSRSMFNFAEHVSKTNFLRLHGNENERVNLEETMKTRKTEWFSSELFCRVALRCKHVWSWMRKWRFCWERIHKRCSIRPQDEAFELFVQIGELFVSLPIVQSRVDTQPLLLLFHSPITILQWSENFWRISQTVPTCTVSEHWWAQHTK